MVEHDRHRQVAEQVCIAGDPIGTCDQLDMPAESSDSFRKRLHHLDRCAGRVGEIDLLFAAASDENAVARLAATMDCTTSRRLKLSSIFCFLATGCSRRLCQSGRLLARI
jgi:hypothetical protein